MIKDYFKMASRNLKRRGLRSWLTMLGIFISIAAIFTLVSLSLGLQAAVVAQFEELGSNKFFVLPATGFLGPPGSVGGVILTEDDIDVLKKVNGVENLAYVVVGNGATEHNGKTRYGFIYGVPLDKEYLGIDESFSIEAIEGRYLQERDLNEIALGYSYSQSDLFGRRVQIGEKIDINGKKFDVVGIMESMGNPTDDSAVYMPLDSFRELMNISERVDQIIVEVKTGEDVLEVSERAEKELRKSRDVDEDNQDFLISTPEDLLESFQVILNIITAFLAGVAGISLVVGAIGISNTMYTSVIERTKEIGTMKAIGAKNKDILLIFLIESGLLGLLGAIIGILLGYGLSKGIEFFVVSVYNTNLLQVSTPWWLIFGCLSFGFLIGVISGTFPAWQASKTKVVDALRYE